MVEFSSSLYDLFDFSPLNINFNFWTNYKLSTAKYENDIWLELLK